MADIHELLQRPLYTEKGLNLKEKENKIVFRVKRTQISAR